MKEGPETDNVPRKVVLSTDGRIFVDGERGMREIEDPDFIRYIRKGMKATEITLTSAAQAAADAAYAERIELEDRNKGIGKLLEECLSEMPDDEFHENWENAKKNTSEVTQYDPVNHPQHYCNHPSGVECIEVARNYDFNIGNAIKYLWRHGLKYTDDSDRIDKAVEDLEKAVWYINDEIKCIKKLYK